MNSGIKAAIAWSNRISDLVLERNEGLVGLQPLALSPFVAFMNDLREREHTHRSFVIQDNSGSPERMQEILKNSSTQHKQDWEICSTLYGRVVDFANRLEGREAPRWHHEKIEGLRGKFLGFCSN